MVKDLKEVRAHIVKRAIAKHIDDIWVMEYPRDLKEFDLVERNRIVEAIYELIKRV